MVSHSSWTREPWAWFIVATLGVTLIVGITLVTLSVRYGDSVVVADYYQAGLAINHNLSREKKAQALHIRAHLHFNDSQRALLLRLDQEGNTAFNQLTLRLLSPTIQEKDQVVRLYKVGNGHYKGNLAKKPSGRYYVQLTTAQEHHFLDEKTGAQSLPGWQVNTHMIFDQRTDYTLTATH